MTEIQTEFSLREQLEELQVVYKSRKDFIEGKIARGQPIAPSKDLALYGLARLKAAGETLRKLYEQERAGATAAAAPPLQTPQSPPPPPAPPPSAAPTVDPDAIDDGW